MPDVDAGVAPPPPPDAAPMPPPTETWTIRTSCDVPMPPPDVTGVGAGPDFLWAPGNLPLVELAVDDSTWRRVCEHAVMKAQCVPVAGMQCSPVWEPVTFRMGPETVADAGLHIFGRYTLVHQFEDCQCSRSDGSPCAWPDATGCSCDWDRCASFQNCLDHRFNLAGGSAKSSYKLAFGRASPGLHWHDLKHLALEGTAGNGILSEYVYAQMAGKIGADARRVSHALVCVNGHYEGVFSLEEPPEDHAFLRHHYPASDTGELFKVYGDGPMTYPTDSGDYYLARYKPEAGTPETDPVALRALLAFANRTSNAELDAGLERWIDVRQWLGVVATEMTYLDYDGAHDRHNNYLLYHARDVGEGWRLVRYDTDSLFLQRPAWDGVSGDDLPLFCYQDDTLAGSYNCPDGRAPAASTDMTVDEVRRSVLTSRLLYVRQSQYLDRVQALIDACDGACLDAMIDERVTTLAPWFGDPQRDAEMSGSRFRASGETWKSDLSNARDLAERQVRYVRDHAGMVCAPPAMPPGCPR